MEVQIKGAPTFAHLHVDLGPQEVIVAEADAMASMDPAIETKLQLNGDGLFSALLKKFLGGETLFKLKFRNPTQTVRKIVLTQPVPGSVLEMELQGQSLFLEPGSYIASTEGVSLGLRWAGFASFIGGEGLFKLEVSGSGRVWFGSYGAVLERQLNGEVIVDSGHLVAYDPSIRLRLQLSGGIFSSFFGGEGFVMRLEGKGRYWIQTRSLSGFARWLNPRLPR